MHYRQSYSQSPLFLSVEEPDPFFSFSAEELAKWKASWPGSWVITLQAHCPIYRHSSLSVSPEPQILCFPGEVPTASPTDLL